MRLAVIFLISGTLFALPASGFAITLTNRDTIEQRIIVIEGDKQTERVIKAGEKLDLCEKSCVIRLPDGEDYTFDGGEVVSLEEGLLFLDDPEAEKKTAG